MALSTEEIKRQGTRVQEETQNMNRKCGELKDYCSRIADKLRESDDASAQKCANEWLTIGETFSKIGLKFYNYGNKLSTSLYQYTKETQKLEEEAAAKAVAVNSELQNVADSIDNF